MKQIKVSELFYSVQGEGRYQGVPSVFLRTFGCNFSCSGFGMSKNETSKERDSIAENISLYKNYKDLPLVTTGCDSYASWDVRFKHLSPLLDTDSIADTISSMLPYKQWRDEHLVITGGEPLLGWQRSYPELLDNAKMQDLKELTFETNGTQDLTDSFFHYLNNDCNVSEITFSVSPKLSLSGELWKDAIRPEIVCDYELIGPTYLKFVVTGEQDTEEIQDAVSAYRKCGFKGHVYLMPVGGVEQVYSQHNKKVAELAMKLGYRYSDRLQVPLFKNAWGT